MRYTDTGDCQQCAGLDRCYHVPNPEDPAYYIDGSTGTVHLYMQRYRIKGNDGATYYARALRSRLGSPSIRVGSLIMGSRGFVQVASVEQVRP